MAKLKKNARVKLLWASLFALSLVAIIFIWSKTIKTVEKVSSAAGCTPISWTGEIDPADKIGLYEGREVTVPELALKEDVGTRVLGVSSANKWIEVDLSEQKLKAWDGGNLFLETLVSTGLPWFPTPKGEYLIWAKVRATKMEGGQGNLYYYLPNVPYVMFFENSDVPGYRGYSLHGTYWHNDFGRVHSHGCVNLPTAVAEKLYYWIDPQMPSGKSFVRATAENPGTKIVIHE